MTRPTPPSTRLGARRATRFAARFAGGVVIGLPRVLATRATVLAATTLMVIAALAITIVAARNSAIDASASPVGTIAFNVERSEIGTSRATRSVAADRGCAAIQAAIDALPPGGGDVLLSTGTYTCTRPIVIARDHVTLRGRGYATILKLADAADAPVLILGDDAAVPNVERTDIRVADLQIDGNRFAQTRECMLPGPCSAANPLRNHGLTLRGVSDAAIERVFVHNARASGLACEHGCKNVAVRGLTSMHNLHAGLSLSDTEASSFESIHLHNNCGSAVAGGHGVEHNVLAKLHLTRDAAAGSCADAESSIERGSAITMRDAHTNIVAQVHVDAAHDVR